MKLYVVHRTTYGFAREDPRESEAVGVYTDKEVARKVAVAARGSYEEVELNDIWPGIRAHMKDLGMKGVDELRTKYN